MIPDCQIRPGVPVDHLRWIGKAIVEYKPDVVVCIGDFWDFPSLNSHEGAGSAPMEGRRFKDDLDAGNEGFRILCEPMERELRRSRAWKPRRIFLDGNHEDRADRTSIADPKYIGLVSSDSCDRRGWERHRFLERVWVDGICYSHYFQSSHSNRPIGGEVSNRLNRIGASFVQGHEQGFRYGNRICGSGRTWHGLVAGSCYLHIENYRGAQGQQHWRGICVLNEVEDGDFCIMPLTLSYLCRKYEHLSLADYMVRKYAYQDWRHLGSHHMPKSPKNGAIPIRKAA